MLKKFMLVLAIFVCVGQFFILPIFQSGAYAAAEKKEYIFGAHFESVSGLASVQMLDIYNTLAELITKKTGIGISIKRFSNYENAYESFVKGEINGMLVGPTEAVSLNEKKIEILPFLGYNIKKRDKTAWCLWQKKDKIYADLSNIIGTTLLGTFDSIGYTIFQMEFLRDYLYKNGIDKPLWKVFKDFKKVANVNSAFLAVGTGKEGDFYWESDDYDYFLKLMLPSIFAHISHNFCTDRIFDRWQIVISRKTVDNKDYKLLVEAAKEILITYEEVFKKDKNLRSYLQMAKTVKLEPFVAVSVPYQEEIKIWEKSKKNGWYEESKFLAEKLFKAEKGQLVIIKFTFEDCKAKCKSAKNQLVCMDECMR